MTHRKAASLNGPPLACAALALAVAGVAVVASVAGGNWRVSVLVRMSGSEPMAMVAQAADPDFAFVDPDAHYDGVYFYAIARDPFALGVEHSLIDRAPYRYGHPGYGWLAGLASAGQPALLPIGLLAVGLAGLATAAATASLLSRDLGWSAWGGLVVPFNPGLIYAVTADTSEAVGAAVMGLALLACFRGNLPAVAGLLVLLCLIKEQFVLVPIGLAIWEAISSLRGDGPPSLLRRFAVLAGGPIALGLWFVYLRIQFGVWPFAEGQHNLTLPIAGWFQSFRRASAMGVGGFDEMQIGQASVPILAVTAGTFAYGALRALKLRSALDPIYLLFALMVFCLNWWNLLYPKDLIRALAVPLLLLPAALLGPRQSCGVPQSD